METVEVVLINWKRPDNIKKVIARLREQTWPITITLVDCAAGPEFQLPNDVKQSADNLYTLHENYLCFNRYVPAFNYHSDFTLFLDDDMLPGKKCVEHFVKASRDRKDCSLFGQIGRKFWKQYQARTIPRKHQEFVPVDLIVRGYFLRTRCLPDVLRLRLELDQSVRNDDMLLAVAIGRITQSPILLTPLDGDPESLMNLEELPAPYAAADEPDHRSSREAFWVEVNKAARKLTPNKHKDNLRICLRGIEEIKIRITGKLNNLITESKFRKKSPPQS